MARKLSMVAITTCGVLLSACGVTFDYEALREKKLSGPEFELALAREYRTLALFEADEMFDWPDAARYGRKALAAEQGQRVPPELVSTRDIPQPFLGTMASAYADLQRHLRSDAKRRTPDILARAQAHYDCWIEQQEEAWQRDDIAHCRTIFQAAMTTLEGKSFLGFKRFSAPALHQVRGLAASPGQQAAPKAVTLFFDFDSDALTQESLGVIRRIAENVKKGGQVALQLSGHTDRAGPQPYNYKLSSRRAAAVLQEFRRTGVAGHQIQTRAYGEVRPRVSTPDGLREPRNRRVEIIIGVVSSL